MRSEKEIRAAQRMRIMAKLQNDGQVTEVYAREVLKCKRLGARIYELRRAGLNIRTDTPYYIDWGRGRERTTRYVLV